MAQWDRDDRRRGRSVSRITAVAEHTYRGKPFDEPLLSLAFQAVSDPTHVQLIHQASATPSVYRDMCTPARRASHTRGGAGARGRPRGRRWPVIEKAGWHRRLDAPGPYVNVAYIDCRDEIGCFVELHGANQTIYDLFELFRTSHEEWDGVTDPVRVRSKTSSR